MSEITELERPRREKVLVYWGWIAGSQLCLAVFRDKVPSSSPSSNITTRKAHQACRSLTPHQRRWSIRTWVVDINLYYREICLHVA